MFQGWKHLLELYARGFSRPVKGCHSLSRICAMCFPYGKDSMYHLLTSVLLTSAAEPIIASIVSPNVWLMGCELAILTAAVANLP